MTRLSRGKAHSHAAFSKFFFFQVFSFICFSFVHSACSNAAPIKKPPRSQDAIPAVAKEVEKAPESLPPADAVVKGRSVQIDEQLQEAQKMETEFQLNLQKYTSQLETAVSLNRRFCERLVKLRSECPLSRRLMEGDDERALKCGPSSSNKPAQKVEQKYRVVASGGGDAVLRLESGGYSTHSFSGDAETQITWTSESSGSRLAPKFWDALPEMRLKVVSGKIPDPTLFKFELKSENNTLIQTDDLIFIEGVIQKFRMMSNRLIDVWKSSQCRVLPQELDVLTEEAKGTSADGEGVK
jgi:hypothetical protein